MGLTPPPPSPTVRLAMITNIVAPYRTALFERLAAEPGVELLVVYESHTEPNRHWSVTGPLPFEHAFLESRTLDLRRLETDAFVHVPRRPLRPLRRFRPDVVVTGGGGAWSSPANLAALLRGDWAAGIWWESPRRPHPSRIRRFAEPWVRGFIRRGDAWIAGGSRAAAEVVRLGADPDGVVIAPNAVPDPEAPPAEGRPHEPVRFLFVGQLIERKGIQVVLDAFAQVDGGELRIVGDGPLRPAVEAAAARDGRITLTPYLDPAALARVYREVDVFVLPSLYEVWGMVVNEALRAGAPAIVSDQVASADDLIRAGENGVVVPAGSAERLAAAMRDLAAWPAERFGGAERRSAEILADWSIDRAAQAIVRGSHLALERRRS